MSDQEIPETSAFCKALTILKTPEAKARTIYTEAKRLAEKQGTRTPKLPQIPENLREGVVTAAQQAIKAEENLLGLTIADSGGVLDEFSAVLGVPFFLDIEAPEFERVREAFPWLYEEATRTSSGGLFPRDSRHDVMNRIRRLATAYTDVGFVRKGMYRKAANTLVCLHERERAIELAFMNLSPVEIVEIVENAGTGFREAIGEMRHRGESDLESRLRYSHVTALKLRAMENNYSGGGVHNLAEAIKTAKAYRLDDSFLQALRNEAVGLLPRVFNSNLARRNDEMGKIVAELRSPELSFYDYNLTEQGRRRRHTKKETILKGLERVADSRVQTISQPDSCARVLYDLKQSGDVSDDQLEDAKLKFYHSCDFYGSSWDGLGIAILFKEWEKAMKYAKNLLLHSDRGCYDDFYTGNPVKGGVKKVVCDRVLPSLDAEGKKEIIEDYLALAVGCIKGADYEEIEAIADQYGLNEFLLKTLRKREHHQWAARTAVKLGRKKDARDLFYAAGNFDSAADNTDDPVNKATFYLRSATQIADRRFQPSLFFDPKRYNAEVEKMQQALALVGDNGAQLQDTTFIGAARGLVSKLVEKGDFSEACAFIRDSGLPRDRFIEFVTDEHLVRAETAGDYGGCCSLARLRGDEAAARSYALLAEHNAPNYTHPPIMPTGLADFIYTPSKSGVQVGAGEDGDEDIPF
ncbi:MAG: hypothetical protein WC796_03765 [Candidatus Pacearchaeota archaeon]|jgi:hypothetical protein